MQATGDRDSAYTKPVLDTYHVFSHRKDPQILHIHKTIYLPAKVFRRTRELWAGKKVEGGGWERGAENSMKTSLCDSILHNESPIQENLF